MLNTCFIRRSFHDRLGRDRRGSWLVGRNIIWNQRKREEPELSVAWNWEASPYFETDYSYSKQYGVEHARIKFLENANIWRKVRATQGSFGCYKT